MEISALPTSTRKCRTLAKTTDKYRGQDKHGTLFKF